MPQTFGATAEFASSAAARAAVTRLLHAGFHRSDIDTWPRDGAHLVHVRSGEDDYADAVRALRARDTRASELVTATASRGAARLLPLGLAALAAAVVYGASRRR